MPLLQIKRLFVGLFSLVGAVGSMKLAKFRYQDPLVYPKLLTFETSESPEAEEIITVLSEESDQPTADDSKLPDPEEKSTEETASPLPEDKPQAKVTVETQEENQTAATTSQNQETPAENQREQEEEIQNRAPEEEVETVVVNSGGGRRTFPTVRKRSGTSNVILRPGRKGASYNAFQKH